MLPSNLSHPAGKPVDWQSPEWIFLHGHLERLAHRMISWLPGGYLQEDLVSEAQERLWRYKRDYPFNSWLELLAFMAQVMRNRLIDLTTATKHQFTQYVENLERPVADRSQSDPYAKLALEQAFECLSERDRELIFLRFVLGWRQNEIAGQWKVSDQAISKRLKRIRIELESHVNN